jgi:APA family basic amino acid/polyamine antiporter
MRAERNLGTLVGDAPATAPREAANPIPALSRTDAIVVIVGIVVGAGIFKTPSLVAASSGSEAAALLLWVAGGAISLIGALCYAELVTAYPHPGGDYHYLGRAYGKPPAFLFAWSRITVLQTGSIALLAFVFGDYASQLFSLGNRSSAIFAALLIIVLTAINLIGLRQGKWTQKILTIAEIAGLLLVVVAGLVVSPAAGVQPAPVDADGPARSSVGLALVFVLLTYGGWNEAAYISSEMRGRRRNLARALLWGIAIITGIYLLVNVALLRGLGLAGMAASEAVAADLMRRWLGETGAELVSVLVAVSAITSANATVLTGARASYALGRDFRVFRPLGRWRSRAGTPGNALLVQGAIALALVLLGSLTRSGFATMVEYTAPVFWFFFLLTGLALIVLRIRDPGTPRRFSVPLYPLTPLLFCASSAYMLWSSLAHTGFGALVGVAVLLAGVPVLFWARRREREPMKLEDQPMERNLRMRTPGLLAVAAVAAAVALAWRSPESASRQEPATQHADVQPEVPFVATREDVVDEMLRMAAVTKDDLVYDLGCGDGRIVITAAKQFGAKGVGVDINPLRIEESNRNARTAGVSDRVKFIEGDLFDADLSKATVVTLYLLPSVNLRLRPKLERELKPGARVVSHNYNMGDWEPSKQTQIGEHTVYLWVIPEKTAATTR